MDAAQHRICVLDPVQHGVAEHGIELVVEAQRCRVGDARVETALQGGPDLLRTAVDRNHLASGRHQALGQRTVAAAEIEHPMTGVRVEQVDDRRAQV